MTFRFRFNLWMFLLGFGLTSVFCFSAFAQSILITTQDYKTESKQFTQEICESIKNIEGVKASVTCTYVSPYDFSNSTVQKLKSEHSYDYHIHVLRLNSKESKFDIKTQIKKQDELDPSEVGIQFHGTDQENKENFVKYFKNILGHHVGQFHYKMQVISELAQYSTDLEIKKDESVVERKTQKPVTWKQAYNILRRESPTMESHLRTLVELGAVLGFATYKYYTNLVVNKVDFDYPDFRSKFKDTVVGTQGWAFDTNKEIYNTGHAGAGVIYYQAARNNGYKPLKAFAITFGSSLFWEIIGEFKEKASINDQIVTSIGGAILGEVGYQVSRAIRRKSSSFLSQLFAGFVDPVGAANRLADKFSGQRREYLNDLSEEQYAELNAYFAVSTGQVSAKRLGFSADIVNIPGYGQDGQSAGIILDTASVQAVVEATNSKLGQEEIKLLTTVAWAAYYKKNIVNKEGYEYSVNLSSAFDYDTRKYPVDDFDLNVHMIGTQLKMNGYYKGFKISAGFDVFADFVMMNSLALASRDAAGNSREGLQSIIKEQGYYYGLGLTQRLRLAVSKAGITGFAEYSNTNVSSINSRDRFSDQVTQNFDYTDTKKTQAVGISYDLTKSLRLTFKVEKLNRQSEISDGSVGGYSTTRKWLQVHYVW
jgi:hypothetical protein